MNIIVLFLYIRKLLPSLLGKWPSGPQVSQVSEAGAQSFWSSFYAVYGRLNSEGAIGVLLGVGR